MSTRKRKASLEEKAGGVAKKAKTAPSASAKAASKPVAKPVAKDDDFVSLCKRDFKEECARKLAPLEGAVRVYEYDCQQLQRKLGEAQGKLEKARAQLSVARQEVVQETSKREELWSGMFKP
jgi:predicted RNase H-like nuclease (RuvC/YqgF family)